jgi:hypothetical protein
MFCAVLFASGFKPQACNLRPVACGLWLVAEVNIHQPSPRDFEAAKVQLLLLIGFLVKYTRSGEKKVLNFEFLVLS